MNRRQCLARAGAGLGVVTLAGCLGTLSGDDEGHEVADRTGERALSRAVGELNDAALAIYEADLDATDADDVEFDAAAPQAHLEQADDYLDTAEAELDGQAADLAELRAYADVLAVIVETTDLVADEALTDELEQVSTALEAEGDDDLADAQETISERTSTLEAAGAEFDDAIDEFAALEADRLSDLAVIDLDEIESGVAELGSVLEAQTALAAGYDEVLGGYDHLETGREYADDEDHEAAEAAFLEAKQAFEDATETFESADEDAPSNLAEAFDTAHCQSHNLTDAAANFAAAADASTAYDISTAQQRQSEAEDALEAARAC